MVVFGDWRYLCKEKIFKIDGTNLEINVVIKISYLTKFANLLCILWYIINTLTVMVVFGDQLLFIRRKDY